jgi:undecaprenyl-diphosphatase
VLLAAGFLAIERSIHTAAVVGLDTQATLALQRFHTPALDTLMRGTSYLGATGTLWVVVGLVAVALVRGKLWRVLPTLCLVPGSFLVCEALKHGVERARPTPNPIRVIAEAHGYSFPSGHAFWSASVYGFILYLALTQVRSRRWGRLGAALAGLIVLAVCVSRVYLGVHWFTDVVAGVLGGSAYVMAVIWVGEPLGSLLERGLNRAARARRI